ncbi:hypothetical protein AB0D58_24230 [Streptomyces sp. NPDC048210]|uniref:hypothetical protein n=1 Tax=Streptomyces sp. NPDC048210 TaxID=3156657 RepID=UPI00341C9336
MIRETWPQVRITSVAPYGTDHASRHGPAVTGRGRPTPGPRPMPHVACWRTPRRVCGPWASPPTRGTPGRTRPPTVRRPPRSSRGTTVNASGSRGS